MPRTSERISKRDIEVLEFIARHGVVSRSAISVWAKTAQTATFIRERRLREAGLIEVRSLIVEEPKLIAATAAGLRLAGHQHLGCARLSLSTARHDAAAAMLAARLERQGRAVLSEREIAVREQGQPARPLSARLANGRFHRCDLIAFDGEGSAPIAIEVELTRKKSERLDQLLRAWRRAVGKGQFRRVVYFCPKEMGPVVARAIERTQTDRAVKVREL